MLVCFGPDHVNVLLVSLLELLLKIAAAVLVFAKVIYLTFKGLHGHVVVAGHGFSCVSETGLMYAKFRILTFTVNLAAVLYDSGLAITRVIIRVAVAAVSLSRAIPSIVVLRRVHVAAIMTIEVHLLHPTGESSRTVVRRCIRTVGCDVAILLIVARNVIVHRRWPCRGRNIGRRGV